MQSTASAKHAARLAQLRKPLRGKDDLAQLAAILEHAPCAAHARGIECRKIDTAQLGATREHLARVLGSRTAIGARQVFQTVYGGQVEETGEQSIQALHLRTGLHAHRVDLVGDLLPGNLVRTRDEAVDHQRSAVVQIPTFVATHAEPRFLVRDMGAVDRALRPPEVYRTPSRCCAPATAQRMPHVSPAARPRSRRPRISAKP